MAVEINPIEAVTPVVTPNVLFGAFRSGKRGEDAFLRADLERSFRNDPTISAAMHMLENSDGLNPEVAGIIRNLLNQVFQVYALRRENSVLRDAVADLKVAASIDGLTRLLNQQTFRAYGDRVFTHAASNGGRIACVMGDVDRFKRVNDLYGHAAGDEVLRSVGGVVRSTVRERDIAGRDGGEEFGIILPGTDLDGACVFAERLRKRIENMDFTFNNGDNHPVTMSFGVAVRELTDGSFEKLKGRADEGLYAAKKEHGRNAVVLSSVSGKGGLRCISPSDRFRYADDEHGVSELSIWIGGLLRRILKAR